MLSPNPCRRSVKSTVIFMSALCCFRYTGATTFMLTLMNTHTQYAHTHTHRAKSFETNIDSFRRHEEFKKEFKQSVGVIKQMMFFLKLPLQDGTVKCTCNISA